ncbi:hypothetical protein [Limnospira maxima]|uniref:hypothetical protein n=1 Tax=Limnospira TaxID=2596745 RepID=UPI00178C1A90|nr:hypothetical protein [Limnospira maxima]MDC0840153.1 hypothetical protein [Limnoraphis robusta]
MIDDRIQHPYIYLLKAPVRSIFASHYRLRTGYAQNVAFVKRGQKRRSPLSEKLVHRDFLFVLEE